MTQASQRRLPGLGLIIVLAFLLVPLAAVAWWLNRPTGGTAVPGPALNELDVVCLGRVDGLNPVAALEPVMAGRVAEVFVREGDHVTAGHQLLRLDDELLRLRVEEAEAALQAAELELTVARQEQEFYPLRKKTQEALTAAATHRAAAARKLYEERVKSAMFTMVPAAELIAADAEAKQLEQLAEAEKARLAELEKTDPGLRVQAADLKKTTAQIALRQAQRAVRDCVLRAPSNGTVLRVQTTVGEAVMPGGLQAPIVFQPDGPLVVRAEVEQEFLGRVQPQMKATLRDDVRVDSPTWTGRVLSVGNWVARKRNPLMEPGVMNDVRTVECVIALDGNPEGLLVGQRMRVRISRGDP
jgi:multidrug resistance efflux pump